MSLNKAGMGQDMNSTKWYVHVNQHKIRKNIRAENIEPPIAVKRGKSGSTRYANSVRLSSGSTLIYSPHSHILGCGARLVIECDEEPEILD